MAKNNHSTALAGIVISISPSRSALEASEALPTAENLDEEECWLECFPSDDQKEGKKGNYWR